MPARYPGGEVKQAIGNSFLQLDLRALCIKVVVKMKGGAAWQNRECVYSVSFFSAHREINFALQNQII